MNELQAISFYEERAHDALALIATPKRLLVENKLTPKILQLFSKKQNFSFEKWKIANRLKCVLPKFHADPSFVQGVNGRSKFRTNLKIRELAFEKVTSAIRTGLVGPVLMLRYRLYLKFRYRLTLWSIEFNIRKSGVIEPSMSQRPGMRSRFNWFGSFFLYCDDSY